MSIIDTLAVVIGDYLTALAEESTALATYEASMADEPDKPTRVFVAADYEDYVTDLGTWETTSDGYYATWQTKRLTTQAKVDLMIAAVPITNCWFKVPVSGTDYALGVHVIDGANSLRLEAWSDTIPIMV